MTVALITGASSSMNDPRMRRELVSTTSHGASRRSHPSRPDLAALSDTATEDGAQKAAAIYSTYGRPVPLHAKSNVHLASEDDLARDYSDFELGAVPPFGGPVDQVVVDERLAERDSVVLEAGTHERSIRLKAADLVRLTRARVADILREEPNAG
jgi:Aminoacyl-tRNA editing domain